MEILLEPIEESLFTLPFLFIACFLIEYFSHKNIVNQVMKYGRLGPVVGAVVGCIPQCGFSVIAARMLSMNIISDGTLLAVFIATSDEALSILLIHPELWKVFIILIVLKLILAIVTGYVYDYFHHQTNEYEYVQLESCHCDSHEHIAIHAFKHTLKIFAFILITNVFLTVLIELIGEQTFTNILQTNLYLQPLFAGIVGFIPNCAGSVILTQLYVAGGLSFGALVTGLTTSAGVGVLALINYMKDKKKAFSLLALTYVIGLICGYLFLIGGLYVWDVLYRFN